MHIDRAAFLTLASAMACRPTTEPSPARTARVASPPAVTIEAPPPSPPSAPPRAPARDWLASCGELEPPGPACESFTATKMVCADLARLLHPKRGAPVFECIEKGNRTHAMCSFGVTDCLGALTEVTGAAQKACSSTDGCFDREACARTWTATREVYRRDFITCVVEQCDVDVCAWGHARVAQPEEGEALYPGSPIRVME